MPSSNEAQALLMVTILSKTIRAVTCRTAPQYLHIGTVDSPKLAVVEMYAPITATGS